MANEFRKVTDQNGTDHPVCDQTARDLIGKRFVIGSGETYTTLKEGIAEAIKYPNSYVFVKDGAYDIITEFGANYFNNISTYDGIILKNGIHLVFSSNAVVTCNYTGSNADVNEYFSPFYLKDNGDVTIENLQLTSNNTRYAIHDDSTGDNIVRHIYKNCRIIHTTSYASYKQAIGGGLGKSSTIILKDCYFKSPADANTGTVSWHNSSNANALGFIDIDNCEFDSATYGYGNFRFGWYGTSTKKTPIHIHGCKMNVAPVIRQEVNGGSAPQNAEFVLFNNNIPLWLNINSWGAYLATATRTPTGVNVAVTNGAWANISQIITNLPKNTYHELISNIVFTSGVGAMKVEGRVTGGTFAQIANTGEITTSKIANLIFNTSDYDEFRVSLYCANGVTTTGNINFNNLLLRPVQ